MVSASLRRKVRSGLKKKLARHLHGNRAAALNACTMAQVGPRSAQYSDRVKTRMLEEAAVLDREYGITQDLGNVAELHGPALLARAVEQARQQFRLDFRRIDCRSRVHGTNLFNLTAGEILQRSCFLVQSKDSLEGRISISLPCRI